MPVAGWKQLMPVYFYSALVVCLLALSRGDELSLIWKVFLVSLGVLSWTSIEYVLHRFVFHYRPRTAFGRRLIYAAHLAHHENPRATNRLFSSLGVSLPVAAAYLLLTWLVSGSLQTAAHLFAGLTAGYFVYEWLHFQAHHSRPRLRVLRYLRRYHLLHHYQTPKLRYGVTSPLFDLLLGTFRPVRRKPAVSAQKRKSSGAISSSVV